MNIHSILALTDFSRRGDHALGRAAQLCAAHGGVLELLAYLQPGDDAPQDAAVRLSHHALQLAECHGIQVRAANQAARTAEDIQAASRRADLVVWGIAPSRGFRSLFCGQPLEAVLRQARRPVLVVRRAPRQPYRSLIVGVDFSEASHRLVEVGFALEASASVELFHAVSTAFEGKLRYAEVSERAIKAYREEGRRYARDRMFWLTDSYDARRNRVRSAIGHGNPARQLLVQQQRSGAELLVVGKHPAGALTDFLFESTARQVLRDHGGDVLIVPHDFESASGMRARARLGGRSPSVRRLRAGAAERPAWPNPAALTSRAR
ncbi:Nucleotide-binding universal stress protein, UspA family [Burkholderiales bacterium 8X]|nr:Nucleotide-binding universal stress protein, UspA family [Burkholderiales bacterium 8X]